MFKPFLFACALLVAFAIAAATPAHAQHYAMRGWGWSTGNPYYHSYSYHGVYYGGSRGYYGPSYYYPSYGYSYYGSYRR